MRRDRRRMQQERPAHDDGTAAGVEILWMLRANPVENPPARKMLMPVRRRRAAGRPCGRCLRDLLRLIAPGGCVEFNPPPLPGFLRRPARRDCGAATQAFERDRDPRAAAERPVREGRATDVTVHRFHETIGGRAYHIEVTPVRNRWRAQLCRLPGVPTAMMPFYGETPDDAARLLMQWLTLAHRREAMPARAPSSP
jgi:hypothetical protein